MEIDHDFSVGRIGRQCIVVIGYKHFSFHCSLVKIIDCSLGFLAQRFVCYRRIGVVLHLVAVLGGNGFHAFTHIVLRGIVVRLHRDDANLVAVPAMVHLDLPFRKSADLGVTSPAFQFFIDREFNNGTAGAASGVDKSDKKLFIFS